MSDTLSIAAVVILYNPDQDVYANIKSYYEFVDKVYVFDNSETEHSIKSDLLLLSKVEFYQDFENAGIAKRLNSAVELALKDNIGWLLTMDQDSTFPQNEFTMYIDCVSNYKEKHKVAMFGTEYGTGNKDGLSNCEFVEADNLITSGMLLNLAAVTKIGSFDENLFIDSVDHDYVIRAKLNEYSIVQFTTIHLQHSLGHEVYRSSIKTLFLVKKRKRVHSPLRCYYMYRNMLYLEDKYKRKNVYLSQRLRKIVTGNILANVFYGRNALQTLRYIFKARQDYKKNRMGKLLTKL